ncbi:MAG TPA: peptidoglycan DD-metalloendopeptidase family protein [Gaiellaceae bacterium]|nr:peptidoglycan DD-metalloendopeptidase family protein [Gaiellaceae bacterium]
MRRIALALLVLLCVATPALGDDAAKKKSVDARISALHGKIAGQRARASRLQDSIDAYTSRIRALERRVGDVSLHLQTLEADLALHEKRLRALDALYSLQTQRYTTLRAEYALSVRRLDRRLVEIYESGDNSTLDVLFGASSVQQALDRVQYVNEIGIEDRRVAQQVRQAKQSVKRARAKTKRLRSSVRGETAVISARTEQTREVRDALEGAKGELAGARAKEKVKLSDLTAEEQAEASEMDALQAVSARLAEQIRAAQARDAADGTTDQTPSISGLIWPVDGPITSPFGWRWGRMHEGIDIGVAYGTAIHAAAAGTVIYCGWEEGYGNFVVLDHGGGLATAYGHQSQIAVTCGQHVDQGQVIGYVGCTGHCTGPHLHFEVRINGNAADPMGYL